MAIENYNTLSVRSKNDIPYLVWELLSEDEKLTSDNIGKQVWVAGDPFYAYKELKKIHVKGEPMWLEESGYTLVDDLGMKYCLNTDSVRLHPRELKGSGV
jgi:hypothetical protein